MRGEATVFLVDDSKSTFKIFLRSLVLLSEGVLYLAYTFYCMLRTKKMLAAYCIPGLIDDSFIRRDLTLLHVRQEHCSHSHRLVACS
jgi:hypothetical protein